MGDAVEACDPETGATRTQTVEHVWIHQDDDLIDLSVQSDAPNQAAVVAGSSNQQGDEVASRGLRAPSQAGNIASASVTTEETVHTTAEHPWLTMDRGWTPAGELHVGEQIIQLDGRTAIITAVQVVPGAAMMYNLQVSRLHTFAVGVGKYVVHNRCDSAALDRALGGTKGDGFQAHHVIPCECESHPLLQRAGALWKQNGARNGMRLPDNHPLGVANRTAYHRGSHAQYTRYVRGLLDSEYNGLPGGGTPHQANAAINRVLFQSRRYIGGLSRGVRLD